MKALKIIRRLLPIFAPLLLLAATASVVVVAWYVSIIQTGEIDATTKNVAIEYVFNKEVLKNQTSYTVKNLAFFDEDSTDEIDYIEPMAVKLSIKLRNNSSNNIKYTIIFQSEKTIVKDSTYSEITVTSSNYEKLVEDREIYTRTGSGTDQSPYVYTLVTSTTYQADTYYRKDDKSISYIDCVFDSTPQELYTKVSDLKKNKPAGITYEETDKKVMACMISQTDLPVKETYELDNTVTAQTFKTDGSLYTRTGTGTNNDPYVYSKVTSGTYQAGTNYYVDKSITIVNLYLYGVQEIDTALNDDFIYNVTDNGNGNITRTMKTYSFTLTFIAEPQGDVESTENE